MQESTGIGFTFEQYTDYAKWQDAKTAMFQTGNLPDVLFKAELSTQELIRYTDSGQLIDLAPLLEKHAPNLWALLEEKPEWKAAITLPNGKIGALPALTEMPVQNAMWINQAWLTKLKLSMPADKEQLEEVLRAFVKGDPNQNGKTDEIPLSFLGPWDLKYLSHAFGVVANDSNLYVDEAGKVRFWPLEDSFWELAEWLNGLYREKLLDQQGFYTADTLRRVTDEKAPATYGVFFGPNPTALMGFERAKEYVMMPPLAWEGKQIYRDLYGAVTRGTFAVTSACKDPAAVLGWVDTLYTEQGAVQAMAGIEGTDYLVDQEGRWQWSGGVENTAASYLYELTVYDTGNMPWLFPLEFYNRYFETEVARINEELIALQQWVVEPFPVCSLSLAESESIAPLQAELGRYVDEGFAKLVLGQWKTDGQRRTDFAQGLNDRGAEQLRALWQSVYDRVK